MLQSETLPYPISINKSTILSDIFWLLEMNFPSPIYCYNFFNNHIIEFGGSLVFRN